MAQESCGSLPVLLSEASALLGVRHGRGLREVEDRRVSGVHEGHVVQLPGPGELVPLLRLLQLLYPGHDVVEAGQEGAAAARVEREVERGGLAPGQRAALAGLPIGSLVK